MFCTLTPTILTLIIVSSLTTHGSTPKSWGITLATHKQIDLAKELIYKRQPEYIHIPCNNDTLEFAADIREYCSQTWLPAKIILSFEYPVLEGLAKKYPELLVRYILVTTLPLLNRATPKTVTTHLNNLKESLSSKNIVLCAMRPTELNFLSTVLTTAMDGIYLQGVPSAAYADIKKQVHIHQTKTKKPFLLVSDVESREEHKTAHNQGINIALYEDRIITALLRTKARL